MSNSYKEYVSKEELKRAITEAINNNSDEDTSQVDTEQSLEEKIYRLDPITDFERIVNFRINDNRKLEKRYGAKFIIGMAGVIRGALTVSTDEGDYIYYVMATYLMRLKVSSDLTARSETVGSLKGAVFSSQDEKVCIFMFAGSVCVLGGGNLYAYNGTSVSVVDGYVPLIQRMTNRLGVGTSFERVNLLTNKVRARFVADGSTRDFRLNFAVTSVDAVYVEGTLIDTSKYTVTINERLTTVTTTSVYASSDDENDIIEIWFTLSQDSTRDRIISCKNAIIYNGNVDSRVIFYGGNESAVIFPSEPSDAYTGSKPSYDYFPVNSEIVIGDGNLAVTGACRQLDRLALFTSESSYYTYPKDEEINGIKTQTFTIYPLSQTTGATSIGRAVSCDGAMYWLHDGKLYYTNSTLIRDENQFIIITPPDYLGFKANYQSMTLYANSNYKEIWCYYNENIAVYSIKNNCWYQFTSSEIPINGLFDFKGDAAYFSEKSFRIFTETIHSDGLKNFIPECETKWLDFNDTVNWKLIRKFDITVDDSGTENRSIDIKVTASNKQASQSQNNQSQEENIPTQDDASESTATTQLHESTVTLNVPASETPLTYIKRSQLGRLSCAKIKITAASDTLAYQIGTIDLKVIKKQLNNKHIGNNI